MTLPADYLVYPYRRPGMDHDRYTYSNVLQRKPLEWPGAPDKSIDRTNLGKYFFEVQDPGSGRVLYSRGFASIYGEWETTEEAGTMHRAFGESLAFVSLVLPAWAALVGIGALIGAGGLDPPFVGIMSNGTSGNINNVNYGGEPPGRREPFEQIRAVAASVADAAFRAYRNIEHTGDVTLAAAQAEVELVHRRLSSTHWKRRLPTVAMVSQTAVGEYYLRPVDY